MVFDTLKNCKEYYCLNDKFKPAFEFLNKAAAEGVENGKYEIDGDEIYAIVSEYKPKAEEDCRLEAHRRYIDIQCLLGGTEIIGVFDLAKGKSSVAYNEEKDVEFFEKSENMSRLVLNKNDFCMLMPWDLHMPSIAFDDCESVKKVVVKIKI